MYAAYTYACEYSPSQLADFRIALYNRYYIANTTMK